MDMEEGLSFDDSDHFDEDSLCSWMSEPESFCKNWRGWQMQNSNNTVVPASNQKNIRRERNVLQIKIFTSIGGCCA